MKHGKLFSKLGRNIADRTQTRRTRANRYAAYLSALTLGKAVNSGKGAFSSGKRAGKRGGSHKRFKTAGLKCCSGFQFQCCSGRAVLHNYRNFQKSAVPARLMYFWNGTWNDFSIEASDSLREAFLAGKPTVEVVIDGSSYLVDFLRMLQIDLGAGCQRSIAWIDKNGSCFFPKFFFEDNNVDNEAPPQVEVEIEIRISPTEGSKTDKCDRDGNLEPYSEASKTEKYGLVGNLDPLPEVSKTENYGFAGGLKTGKPAIKASIGFPAGTDESERDSSDAGNPTAVLCSECSKESVLEEEAGGGIIDASRGLKSWQSTSLETPDMVDKLIKLEDGDDEYVMVRNRFLAGFSKFGDMATVAAIYRHTHGATFGQSRLDAFRRQVEITRTSRGNANVRYAWHGTCGKGAAGIILHGFSQPKTSDNGSAYGIGIYLAPEDCSQLSAAFSDVDKNGERYMVLCRVIMGNMEQVCYGSHQFHPSSDKFDSGVDDLNNPKCYIIWTTHMKAHILPEYIVSFKVPHQLHEYWAGLKAKRGMFGLSKPLNNDVQLGRMGSICETAGVHQPCPVSIKEDQHKVRGGSKEAARMATSTSMSFPKLFSVIGESLPATSIISLERLYAEYKAGRIGKDTLIRRVRMIAGDKLLIAAIQSIRGQTNGTQTIKKMECGPRSILASEKQDQKNEFVSFENQTNRTQMIDRMECAPHSLMASEKPDLKNECTTFKNQTDCIQVFDRAEHGPCSLLDSSILHVRNEFPSLMNQASEIGGQSGLDGQSPTRIKPVIKEA